MLHRTVLPPGTLVLLGDSECDAPLPEQLAPAMAAGWDVRWIHGNRDTIFPEDFERLRGARFDVLVTHEASSSHPHGFAPIDELAAQGGARWIVHGHHHQSYAATLPNGIRVRGLGLAECWSGGQPVAIE